MIHTSTPAPTSPTVRAFTGDPGIRNGQTAGCAGCTTRWPIGAGAVAHCPTCHLTFASVGGFDAHRAGPTTHHRRCLDEAELRGLGYAPNDLDRWRVPIDPDAAARLAERTTG
ncbi:hypothetical protein BBK14_07970 [Parafrankia soli]|uniref:Phage FDXHR zinc binding domain-containing protein n=1 Tax=Parafrankia soli TaxID=2599596 RepID=A0A1S1PE77_9ACTN|nr:hypothetical protein [Parafrankia soli]OHV21203.1 hypothetical protein BBK14_07970 [Parafrankia soli]